MFKILRWVFWRLLALAPLLLWAAAGGPLLAPVMWALLGYLVWRALPGVRSDLDRVMSGLTRRRGRFSSSGTSGLL